MPNTLSVFGAAAPRHQRYKRHLFGLSILPVIGSARRSYVHG